MDNDFMSFVTAKSRVYTWTCHGKGACITHEAMSLRRATQEGWVIAESSDKMSSTEGGKSKSPQYTCRGNLMNCIKGQKDVTPKIESPRSEGV